jgi:hypothetical protein
MGKEDSTSTASVPAGEYSTNKAESPPAKAPASRSAARAPTDAVRVVAVADRVTVSFDAREHATRLMIRRLNEK